MKSRINARIIEFKVEDEVPEKIGVYELELPFGTAEKPTLLQKNQASEFIHRFRTFQDVFFNYQISDEDHVTGDCYGDIIGRYSERYLENSWPSILRTSSPKDYDKIMTKLIEMSKKMNIPLIQDESVIAKFTEISKKLDFAWFVNWRKL